MKNKTRIIGIDPGLRITGWGVIEIQNNKIGFVSAGNIKTNTDDNLAIRLNQIFAELTQVIKKTKPHEAAVEETFVNKNAKSTLKLGHARAIALLVPAIAGINVAEYAPAKIKKTVTGGGRAQKGQVAHMVKMIIPKAKTKTEDEDDAIAIAICHAHYRNAKQYI